MSPNPGEPPDHLYTPENPGPPTDAPHAPYATDPNWSPVDVADVSSSWVPEYPWGQPDTMEFAHLSQHVDNWTYAPPTSHISRFAYNDARSNEMVAHYGHNEGASQLHVVFKNGMGSAPEHSEYVYYFYDHDVGRNVWELLNTSPHPYSFVLYPQVILGQIPYTRLAKV